MGPTRQTPPADRRWRLDQCAQLLALLAAGYPGARVRYHPSAPLLWLLVDERPVLVLGLSGKLCLDNGGNFRDELRALLNHALAAVGRPEVLAAVGRRGWCVVGGPHQGPGPLGLTPQGRLAFLAQWPPLNE